MKITTEQLQATLGGSHILKKDIPLTVRALHRARTATTRERHQKWYIH